MKFSFSKTVVFVMILTLVSSISIITISSDEKVYAQNVKLDLDNPKHEKISSDVIKKIKIKTLIKSNLPVDKSLPQLTQEPPYSPLTQEPSQITQSALNKSLIDLEKQDTKKNKDMITVILQVDDISEEEINQLETHGAEIQTRSKKNLQVSIPYGEVENIVNMKYIKSIKAPKPILLDIVSQGVGVINSDQVNTAGFTGAGVKVAVIDSGFDITDSEISGNIVESISFRSSDGDITGGSIGNRNHGTATAQIVLDVAPDAELYLYNTQFSSEFEDVIDFIINNRDIDIITQSLAMFTTPYDGTNFVSMKANEARNAGILFINSAGNYAQGHWQGTFTDGDADNNHNFSGVDETIQITASVGEVVTIQLYWDETWGAASQDYDLFIWDSTLTTVIASSEDAQTGIQDPEESVSFIAPYSGTYHINIQKFSATQSVNFELFSFDYDFDEYNVQSNSIVAPADATGVMSVGAMYFGNDQLESFSSRGPTDDGRIKPDISGPDGVTTSTLNPFYGTSASAPYVAGAAALVKEAIPTASANTIQNLLEQNTLSNHAKNNNDGTGRLDVSFLTSIGSQDDFAVYKVSDGNWFITTDHDRITDIRVRYGGVGHTPMVGDFNGDGTDDLAIYRFDGIWFISTDLNSTTEYRIRFGGVGLEPLVGDFNNDGSTDLAIYETATGNWDITTDLDGIFDIRVGFGGAGLEPLVGDFNNDGTDDMAIYETATGNWNIDTNFDATPDISIKYGGVAYEPLVGDFNNDGTDDMALYKVSNGNWEIDTNFDRISDIRVRYGGVGHTPMVGDFNGDGTDDLGIYDVSNGNWFITTNFDRASDIRVRYGGVGLEPLVGNWGN